MVIDTELHLKAFKENTL